MGGGRGVGGKPISDTKISRPDDLVVFLFESQDSTRGVRFDY